jgi:hypothetical protein
MVQWFSGSVVQVGGSTFEVRGFKVQGFNVSAGQWFSGSVVQWSEVDHGLVFGQTGRQTVAGFKAGG